jgi:hypothetical protein
MQISHSLNRLSTVRSPAENLRMECGVVGDVMPFARQTNMKSSTTFDATVYSEKKTHNSFIRQAVVPVALYFRYGQ